MRRRKRKRKRKREEEEEEEEKEEEEEEKEEGAVGKCLLVLREMRKVGKGIWQKGNTSSLSSVPCFHVCHIIKISLHEL